MYTSRKTTRHLIDDLSKTQDLFFKKQSDENPQTKKSMILTSRDFRKSRPTKLHMQKQVSKQKYKKLTDLTVQEQRSKMWQQMNFEKKQNRNWSYQHYKGNHKNSTNDCQRSFSILQKQSLDRFPQNNEKYNIQFLNRSLHGKNLHFQKSAEGEFQTPKLNLYSKHYIPIFKDKVRFNQDWEIRTSIFGKTWVEHKKDKIIDQYQVETIPFKTPRSNDLFSRMSRTKRQRTNKFV